MSSEPFSPGTIIGQFQVLERIGAGGMGVVYLAKDTRLGREVALKVLPDAYVNDPERRMRLEREARLLASLNHPNVATLHGFEEFGAHAILEMELVPGKTLAERLKVEALAASEVVPIFRQIAAGLEAAHERGIIHRDLKPANIKLLPDGRVKVLDFGVGKIFEQGKAFDDVTAVLPASSASSGWIVGTAQYMSPEQARGHAVDPRTDIWSFGCVLYEAVTGAPPFRKETTTDTLAAILREEPDLGAMRHAPQALQRLVRRCLEKDPQARLRHIGDTRFDLDDALVETKRLPPVRDGEPIRTPRAMRTRWWIAMAATFLVAAAAAASWYVARTPPPSADAIRVAIPVPLGQRFGSGPASVVAVSGDGLRLVYSATSGSRTQLFLRRLDDYDAVALAGTEGATAPFFSSDGQWVGYHARDALYRVSVNGGTPLKIADVPSLAGATWASDDAIWFATAAADGIWRVTASGGTPQRITQPDAARGETRHSYPQVLPGEKTALMTVTAKGQSHPAVLTLATGQWVTLEQVTVAGGAHFAAPGHLIYTNAGGLVAVAFDSAAGQLRGSPIPLLERVDTAIAGASQFALSNTGMLVYLPSETTRASRSLVLTTREGRTIPLTSELAAYAHPRLSPDGRMIAAAVETDTGSDIWIYELQRGTRTRLTADGASAFPVWSPDSRTVTYYSAAVPPWTLFTRAADASSPAQSVLTMTKADAGAAPIAALLPGTLPSLGGANPQFPMSWSGDGRALAFVERKPSAERDIWVVERDTDPTPFLVTPFDESAPAFSSDGKFLAYVSDESGRPEVYVQPYPGPGGRWLISTDGGADPIWVNGTREILYRRERDLFAVSIQTTPTFTAGTPTRILEARLSTSDTGRTYDASPDGQRVLALRGDEAVAGRQFHVIFNWVADIERRTSRR